MERSRCVDYAKRLHALVFAVYEVRRQEVRRRSGLLPQVEEGRPKASRETSINGLQCPGTSTTCKAQVQDPRGVLFGRPEGPGVETQAEGTEETPSQVLKRAYPKV